MKKLFRRCSTEKQPEMEVLKYEPLFTDDEKIILKNLPDTLKWIARDNDGALWVYVDKPIKGKNCYTTMNDGFCCNFQLYGDIFNGIQFETGEVNFREALKYEPLSTDDEKIILKNLPDTLKWIARNSDGGLWVYTERPIKKQYRYTIMNDGLCYNFELYGDLFNSIQFETDEVNFREEIK